MSQYNILVVDDDREIVRSLGKLLELEGYRVKKAYNGMEALDILMTEQIHLILLDVMMPKMNGLSALMKIREKNKLKKNVNMMADVIPDAVKSNMPINNPIKPKPDAFSIAP
jgi:CheY-like chemotaxis protein